MTCVNCGPLWLKCSENVKVGSLSSVIFNYPGVSSSTSDYTWPNLWALANQVLSLSSAVYHCVSLATHSWCCPPPAVPVMTGLGLGPATDCSPGRRASHSFWPAMTWLGCISTGQPREKTSNCCVVNASAVMLAVQWFNLQECDALRSRN